MAVPGACTWWLGRTARHAHDQAHQRQRFRVEDAEANPVPPSATNGSIIDLSPPQSPPEPDRPGQQQE